MSASRSAGTWSTRSSTENLAGRTPIPCVHCNQQVKLARLWEIAQTFGASHVATGHYARLERAADGSARLLAGRDASKDQSYFLFGVPQPVLSRLLFPLGEMTKADARKHAERLGLPNWNKPDSQELCFMPDGDVQGFVDRARPEQRAAGPVLDESGTVHRPATPASRASPSASGAACASPAARRATCCGWWPEQNAVVVGSAGPAAAAAPVGRTSRLGRPSARRALRGRSADPLPPEAGRGADLGGARRFEVEFAEPQRAVAPGQAAVIYSGAAVVGGGFIES